MVKNIYSSSLFYPLLSALMQGSPEDFEEAVSAAQEAYKLWREVDMTMMILFPIK